jgi:DMSO/TMAO reductase YedYZ molybdopterin-dependent catalytic subunit
MPSVPIGQHLVKNWPVLDLGEQPDVSLKDWRLEVAGLVENPFTLSWEEFLALPQTDDVSDFHCVTTWSRLDQPLARCAVQRTCRACRAEGRRQVRFVHGIIVAKE